MRFLFLFSLPILIAQRNSKCESSRRKNADRESVTCLKHQFDQGSLYNGPINDKESKLNELVTKWILRFLLTPMLTGFEILNHASK